MQKGSPLTAENGIMDGHSCLVYIIWFDICGSLSMDQVQVQYMASEKQIDKRVDKEVD